MLELTKELTKERLETIKRISKDVHKIRALFTDKENLYIAKAIRRVEEKLYNEL